VQNNQFILFSFSSAHVDVGACPDNGCPKAHRMFEPLVHSVVLNELTDTFDGVYAKSANDHEESKGRSVPFFPPIFHDFLHCSKLKEPYDKYISLPQITTKSYICQALTFQKNQPSRTAGRLPDFIW